MSRKPSIVVLILLVASLLPGCAELTAGLNQPPVGTSPASPSASEPPPMVLADPASPPPAALTLPESQPNADVIQVVAEAIPDPGPAASPSVNLVAAPPTPTPTEPLTPQGRVIAKVGSEVVTLPQVTAAVKARLAGSSSTDPDLQPTRKQIVRLARSTLEARIVASLVDQEARRVMGPDAASWESAIQTLWQAEELPRQLEREGLSTEAELRPALARKGRSLEEEREAFRVRALAAQVKARGTGKPPAKLSEREFLAFLDILRERFPVESVLTAKQVEAAARDPQDRAGKP